MKAKVKETGEIVDVYLGDSRYIKSSNMSVSFFDDELEFLESDKFNPEYWEKLLHQYAGMAMQGILSNPESELDYKGDETLPQALAGCAAKVATALVEKLKNE